MACSIASPSLQSTESQPGSTPSERCASVILVALLVSARGGILWVVFERFTHRASIVVVLAQEEARSLQHNHIGTEHILLGLLRENEGVAIRILRDFDVDAEMIHTEVLRMLSAPAARQQELKPLRPQQPQQPFDLEWLDGLGTPLNQLAKEIRHELGREPDAGDLLLTLACAPQTLAGQALEELAVNVDVLWSAIERARTEALISQKELRRQIQGLAQSKEQAIEEQRFESASQLRDQERELREQARARIAAPPEVLHEIRRRLGLPSPPDAPETTVS
jgi:ATP-dependent Clp protease ATP-binding subunit ClpA